MNYFKLFLLFLLGCALGGAFGNMVSLWIFFRTLGG